MTNGALRREMARATAEAWEVRRASLHDRDALVALCTAAVGADDYVIPMMEDMTLRGVWHVALDGDRIVGAMHFTRAIDGTGWLAAARTHPDYRRRGMATAILQSLIGLASRSRIPALRLWSSARNAAGNASAKASGFREVARFTRAKRKVARGPERAVKLAFDANVAAEVLRAPLARLANGYVPYDWYFVPLTAANVHLLASAGAFHRVAGGIAAFSVHPEMEWAGALDVGLVAGDPAKILRAMPAVAHALGFKEVHSFLPHDPKVLTAARKAGFENESWGQEAVLFERPVELGPASYRKRPTYAEIAAGKRKGYAALALLTGKHSHGHTGPHEDRWNA